MTDKTVNFLKALSAFAFAATFVSVSSFAGEFTVHQGKRYRATLSLKSVEQLADNALIARRFRALGFTRVHVSGQVRRDESKASGQARIPARPCLRRLLRLLDCNDVSSEKLGQFPKPTRIGARHHFEARRRSWLVVGLFPYQRIAES